MSLAFTPKPSTARAYGVTLMMLATPGIGVIRKVVDNTIDDFVSVSRKPRFIF